MSEQPEQFVLSDEDRMRRRRKLILLLVAIAIVSFGSFSNYGLITRLRLESHRTNILDSLNSLSLVRDSLKQRSSKLLYDTLEIERLAREKYGMAGAKEEVYIIRDEEQK